MWVSAEVQVDKGDPLKSIQVTSFLFFWVNVSLIANADFNANIYF